MKQVDLCCEDVTAPDDQVTVTIIKKKNCNKKVLCTVCGCWMRADNLTRHNKTHSDLVTMTDDDEIRREI